MNGQTRVVIAHDYLSQRGGAERTVLGLLDAFPGARVVTSVYEPSQTYPEFADLDIETLWPNRVPAFRRDPRLALPWLAGAWAGHHIDDADVVVCSSSGWAHGVSTSAPKVVYCHNPARWLYQPEDYLADTGLVARSLRRLLASRLTTWDRARAAEAAAYVVNSNLVAGRVVEQYGRDSAVIPPPVTLDPDGPQEPVPGVEPGFLLTVARSRGYKNVELLCRAVDAMPERRLVALGELPVGSWSDRLRGVGRVADAQLRWLYANCSALVSVSHEDFGLTPLEANLFGRPAVLLRAGGFLDTLVDGITGCFIEAETEAAVKDALARVPAVDPRILRTYAEGFRSPVFAQRIGAVVESVLGRVPTGAVPTQPVPAHASASVGVIRPVLQANG